MELYFAKEIDEINDSDKLLWENSKHISTKNFISLSKRVDKKILKD